MLQSSWIDQGILDAGFAAALAASVLVAVGRLSYPVRRRVVILVLPAAAAAALVRWTFGGFIASSPRFVHPVLLTVPQWAALGAVPVLAFVAGTMWLRRHERMLHRISTAHLDTVDLEKPR
jgi:hypothetical protein